MTNSNTIISTQPSLQAKKLSGLIQSANLDFISMPLIKTKTVELNKKIKRTLNQLHNFNWIIFTSKRGVSGFFKLLKDLNFAENKIKALKFAVIGAPTADELINQGFKANYINPGNTSKEFLFYLLRDVINNCDKILMPLGNLASNYIPNALSEIAELTRINVYETIKLKELSKKTLHLINDNNYQLLVFTSPSAFENFIEITAYKPNDKKLNILSIGQTTTKAIQKYGFDVQITAKKSTVQGLAEEILNVIPNKMKKSTANADKIIYNL